MEKIREEGALSLANTKIKTVDEARDFLRKIVETNTRPDLFGVETETLLLDDKLEPLGFRYGYQPIQAEVMENMGKFSDLVIAGEEEKKKAEVYYKIEGDESSKWLALDGKGCMLSGGKIEGLGEITNETNTTIIEFAGDPTDKVSEIYRQSSLLENSFKEASKLKTYAEGDTSESPSREPKLISWSPHNIGFMPKTNLKDIVKNNGLIPYAPYKYSYENAKNGERLEVCNTSFGNSSFHLNYGFGDPEKIAKAYRINYYLAPMMIAICSNSTLENNSEVKTETTENLLSVRSKRQLTYGNLEGLDGMKYLYPDFLDLGKKDFSFDILLNGIMDLPLYRTVIGEENGNNLKVNLSELEPKGHLSKFTMRNYIENGLEYNGKKYFPTLKTLQMMLIEPMIDVKLKIEEGRSRVESREFDGGPWFMAPAIASFIKAVNTNVEKFEEIFTRHNVSIKDLRNQRQLVPVEGFNTPINKEGKITIGHILEKEIMPLIMEIVPKEEYEFIKPIIKIVKEKESLAKKLLVAVANNIGGAITSLDEKILKTSYKKISKDFGY